MHLFKCVLGCAFEVSPRWPHLPAWLISINRFCWSQRHCYRCNSRWQFHRFFFCGFWAKKYFKRFPTIDRNKNTDKEFYLCPHNYIHSDCGRRTEHVFCTMRCFQLGRWATSRWTEVFPMANDLNINLVFLKNDRHFLKRNKPEEIWMKEHIENIYSTAVKNDQ